MFPPREAVSVRLYSLTPKRAGIVPEIDHRKSLKTKHLEPHALVDIVSTRGHHANTSASSAWSASSDRGGAGVRGYLTLR